MGGSIAHPRWSSLPGIPLLIQSFGSQGGSTALFDDVEEDTNPAKQMRNPVFEKNMEETTEFVIFITEILFSTMGGV